MNNKLFSYLIILASNFKPSPAVSFSDELWYRSSSRTMSPKEIDSSNEIAIRKLQELNRETVDGVNVMIHDFF